MSICPQLTAVGGANGTGKPMFARIFLQDKPEFIFLNADEVARELQPDDLYAARFDAGRECLRRLSELRDAGVSLLLESTLSGLTLARQLRTFATAGYEIRMVYIFLDDASMSVNRVAGRVLSGGHCVPPADIIRRSSRSRHNFWFTYRPLASEWSLISNTSDYFSEIAAYESQQWTILSDEAFWGFVLLLEPNFTLP